MASLPSWLVRRLRGVEDLDVVVDDGTLELQVPGGPAIRYAVELASRLTVEGCRDLARRTAGAGPPRLLVATRKLTEEARSVLREGGVSWVERDTHACWIQGPGLLVERASGDGPAARDPSSDATASSRPAAKLQGKSGVLAETLLITYRRRTVHVRDVAGDAGVSVGLASRLLRRLEREGVVAAAGEHAHKRRRLADPPALLELWIAEENLDAWRRHGLYVWSRTVEDRYARLGKLDEVGVRWALGQTAAANLYAPALTSRPDPEVWISADIPPEHVAEALDGDLVDSGANVFVWQCPNDAPLHHAGRRAADQGPGGGPCAVSRYRAYLEAYHAGGRSRDVARRLREQLALGSGTASP